MPYDLFISYSRCDNVNNRVTELKNQIETDYLEFAKEPLNCFFDQEEIKGMDNWPYRLQQGLKDSHLMLIILSPNYLTSTYCECEIVEYLKYEYSRGVAGDGVAQVYFMEIPGIDDEGFRAKAAQWLEKVSRRQRIDLRPWRDEGADSLKRIDVKKRLEELKESLRKRITRMRVISEVPGNLPAPNPRFVGREREMEMLHKATALGQLGVITAVHGVGGLGKTAIAFQYAYAYANFYPGGRWYLGCANETNLASVIKRLDADLNITLTEDEKKDDTRGAKRILNELYNRAVENAEKANSKSNITETVKEFIKPAVLLILDNVDHPELIQPPCSDIISGKEWLKILVTTRMGPEELGEDETTQKLLSIDELPFDDGVSLIESYQLGGRFKNSEEKEKAGEIIKLLGGFTLAVEVAALYLYEKKGRVSCAEFLDVLKSNGVDYFGEHTNKQLSHTKLISATLAPTLDTLSPEESLILNYAALLPPDSIPLPWLKELVAKEYPQLCEVEMAGIDNLWISTINHLLSLRLLQVSEVDNESNYPRIVRMHRLVGELVRNTDSDIESHRGYLFDHARERFDYLKNGWIEWRNRWEIGPLAALADLHMDDYDWDRGLWLANKVADLWQNLGKFSDAEHFFRRVLNAREQILGPEMPDTLNSINKLAIVLRIKGDYKGAEILHRRSLEVRERTLGPDHPDTLTTVGNLGVCLYSQGDYSGAEILYRRVMEGRERISGPEHPQVIAIMNNLATLLYDKGDFSGAEPLYRRVLEADERISGPEHPYTLKSMSNLAALLLAVGDFSGAEDLMHQAIEAQERILGPEHPETLWSLRNLAGLLYRKGDYLAAEPLDRRVLEARERILGPKHPNTLDSVNNLAVLLDAKGDFGDALVLYKHAYERRKEILGSEHPDTKNSLQLLTKLREKMRRNEELKEFYLCSTEKKVDESTPLELRQRAMDYFNLKDYINAEMLLNRVLAEKFELPGTYCHLARIFILTDRLLEAKVHINEAWQHRADSPVYVVARILWFKIAFSFLTKSSIDNYIGQLKTVLQKEDAFMEWTMQPVLDYLKPKVTLEHHALLSALVDAMSFKEKMELLNSFLEWRNAKPEEID
jgi:tetratricopeptide (TPR) repeat protein